MEIGINAMSAISAMRMDFAGSIHRLKEGGCAYIEAMSDWGATQKTIDFYAGFTGGASGWDKENTIRRIEEMKKSDLYVKGMFVFDEVLEEQAEELGQYCGEYGISYVVVSFLEYKDIEDIYNKIAMIKAVSAKIRKYGVQILIHNHEHDTVLIKDKDGKEKQTLAIFLEQCTPDELMLETDTGWLVYAGVDAAAYVRENLDRIAVLHLKDICKGFEHMPREEVFVPCGQGVVDFPEIIKAAQKKDSVQYVLDQDMSKEDIIEDHIKSLQYFSQLKLE